MSDKLNALRNTPLPGTTRVWLPNWSRLAVWYLPFTNTWIIYSSIQLTSSRCRMFSPDVDHLQSKSKLHKPVSVTQGLLRTDVRFTELSWNVAKNCALHQLLFVGPHTLKQIHIFWMEHRPSSVNWNISFELRFGCFAFLRAKILLITKCNGSGRFSNGSHFQWNHQNLHKFLLEAPRSARQHVVEKLASTECHWQLQKSLL